MCFALQPRALFPHRNVQKWSDYGVFRTLLLKNVLRATTACTVSTAQLPKVIRTWCVLYILTWKCALRHNGVHFFDISTSKSAPNLVCFARFDLKMCFAPQRRAFFGHPGVFCTFWLGHVLCATWAYFSTLRNHKSLETTMNCDFSTFSRNFFFLTLSLLCSLLILLTSAFQLSILSAVSLENFLW